MTSSCHGRHKHAYPTQSIPCLLKVWRRKEPRHSQPWYRPISPGSGSFSKAMVTFKRLAGSFNLFKYHHRGCLNNPIFSNFELYAACWARFMCHHELCSTSGSHPFSFNNSLGLAGRKHCQKITIYRLWLHGLYGLHIPRCLLSEKVRQI